MSNAYRIKYGGLPVVSSVKSVLQVVWSFPQRCPKCKNSDTNFIRHGWGCDWVLCHNCNYVAWLDNQTR